jgi:hypothetical protein
LPLPVYYLRVEIEILRGDETWEQCVQRICSPRTIQRPKKLAYL